MCQGPLLATRESLTFGEAIKSHVFLPSVPLTKGKSEGLPCPSERYTQATQHPVKLMARCCLGSGQPDMAGEHGRVAVNRVASFHAAPWSHQDRSKEAVWEDCSGAPGRGV